MDIFIIITSLFAIASIFSFVNSRFIKLPGVIGVMILAIITSLGTVFAGWMFPWLAEFILRLTSSIDFSRTLLDIMLGFLLFASALHFEIGKLRENVRGILTISTVGVILSTLFFGTVLYFLLGIFSTPIPFIYCLLFGAIVSPTDAVAVAALLKKSKMPPRLESIISGESLFNDGIGLVLFISFLEVTTTPGKSFDVLEALKLFGQEVLGGLLLGLFFGWIALKMIRSVKDFETIVLISITLVMGISVLAGLLHVSIPLAVVAAGLLLSAQFKRSIEVRESGTYLVRFWGLVDELMNTILFVMIGLQMVVMRFDATNFLMGTLAILVLLLARGLSITFPVVLVRRSLRLPYNSMFILTWGGLRGGISVAMALSLPESAYREFILTGCFIIVVFSIIVQGLSLNAVVNRMVK